MSNGTRDPRSFLQLIRRSERGRLKIYLGYAPGVGKTYLMLQEAHRIKQEGIDVVVGLVETHGRQDTADLIEGLEVVPRRKLEYRGIVLEEMDTEAVLARRPQLALVDELAHTNPPGSRNPKRFMDVEDLLAAGIHVISTMNVQHLESLYNTVESLVQVRVAERLPDEMLKEADQIVNVDLSPEDLIKRLQMGKIYPRERIALAAENYFRTPNLEQLRELTLRETASQIDFKRREHPDESGHVPPDQVLVCLSASGTNNAHLLRYGSRLAGRLNRRWYAVHVQTPEDDPLRMDAGQQRILSETLTLANQLGAMVFTFKGQDVVDTALRFAREYRVGHLVIGRSRPLPLWRRLLRQRNLVEDLIEKGSGFRIVVLDERLPEPADISEVAVTPERLATPALPKLTLSTEMTERSIVIWDAPVAKEQAMHDLLTAIQLRYPQVTLEEGEEALRQREQEMSTFLNEGLAVPHAQLDSLDQICFALGVAREGIINAETAVPVDVVFMALYPVRLSERYLQLLSKVATLFRDRRARAQFRAAGNPAEVIGLLEELESARH